MKMKKTYIIATLLVSFGMVGCSGQQIETFKEENVAVEVAVEPIEDEKNNERGEATKEVEDLADGKESEPVEVVRHETTEVLEQDKITYEIDSIEINEQEKTEEQDEKSDLGNLKIVEKEPEDNKVEEKEIKPELTSNSNEEEVQTEEDKPIEVEKEKTTKVVEPAEEVDAVTAATDLVGGQDPSVVVEESYGILNTKLTKVHKIDGNIYLTIVLHEGNDEVYDFLVNGKEITPNRINREGTILRHALVGNERKVTLTVANATQEEKITFSH